MLLQGPLHFDYGVRTLYDWPFNAIRLYSLSSCASSVELTEKSRNPDHATPTGYHT